MALLLALQFSPTASSANFVADVDAELSALARSLVLDVAGEGAVPDVPTLLPGDQTMLGSLIPGGDLDGDGLGDALHEASYVTRPVMEIEARTGLDGRVLWRRAFGGRLAGDILLTAIEGRRLDGGPTSDVLMVEYEEVRALGSAISRLSLTPVRGEDGTTMATIDQIGGRFEHYGQPPRSIAVDSGVQHQSRELLFGIGPDANGDGGDDVLIGALSGSETGGRGTWELALRLVTPSTGETLSRVTVTGQDIIPMGWLLPDRCGDASADVVTLSPRATLDGGVVTVATHDGKTGAGCSHPLEFETAARYFRARPANLDGDDRADLILTGWDRATFDSRYPLMTWGISDDGRELWRRAGATLAPIGDANGDGADDLLQSSTESSAEGGKRVRAAVYSGRDLSLVWYRTYGPWPGANIVETERDAGDLNADGVRDSTVLSAYSDDGGTTYASGRISAIDGASGEVAWEYEIQPRTPALEIPIPMREDVTGDGGQDLLAVDLVRGEGFGMVLVAISGGTGRVGWGPLQGPTVKRGGYPYAFATAQDVTGDTRAEILTMIGTATTSQAGYRGSVESGTDGVRLWEIMYP